MRTAAIQPADYRPEAPDALRDIPLIPRRATRPRGRIAAAGAGADAVRSPPARRDSDAFAGRKRRSPTASLFAVEEPGDRKGCGRPPQAAVATRCSNGA